MGLLLGGCWSPPKAEEPENDLLSSSPPPRKKRTPPPEEDSEPAPDPEPVTTVGGSDEPEGPPEMVDISAADCRLLAQTYRRATKNDETAKLHPKLTDKQREQALENINRVAAELESRWFDTCVENLVDKERDRKSLDCAARAKTVKEFDVCLNGE
jgi:hypothetical protein